MRNNRGIFWPLLLIIVGVLFLLANFGYIAPLSLGRVVALLWPLVLVLIGIDIAFARRYPVAALAAEVAVLALGVALVTTRVGADFDLFRFGPTGESSINIPRQGAKSQSLTVNVGGGTLRFTGGASDLLEARSDSSGLTQRVTRRGDNVDVRISEEDIPFGRTPNNVDIRVADDIPLALTVNAGVGDFTVDLHDVLVSDLRISTGASNLFLTLPKPSGELRVRLESGASSIVIEIPSGVEARVTTSGGLISVNGRTETPGYASARDRVTVAISAGASSISVR